MKVLLLCMAILASLVSGVKAEELEADFFKNYTVESVSLCEDGEPRIVEELVAYSYSLGDTIELSMIGGFDDAIAGDIIRVGNETFEIRSIHVVKCFEI